MQSTLNPVKICSVSECENRVLARGLCSKHYDRFMRHGSTDKMKPGKQRVPPEIRFWRHIKKTRKCWLWTATTNHNGYGMFHEGISKHIVTAHRFSYRLANGDFDSSLYVCHKCDNPSCVNPKHLFLGTAMDNHTDMEKKGRRKNHHGTNNGQAKLDETKVREIRRLYKEGMTQKAIAEQMGVSIYPVWSVLSGLFWKHVK